MNDLSDTFPWFKRIYGGLSGLVLLGGLCLVLGHYSALDVEKAAIFGATIGVVLGVGVPGMFWYRPP